MTENTRLILAGLGGGVLAMAYLLGFGLDKDVLPTAEAPVSASHPGCPSGWTPDSPEGDDHLVVYKCLRDDWQVVVFEDGSFDHAWQTGTPGGFVFDSGKVPNW